MGDPDSSSTETDGEEWSEDTLPSSPQHAGYIPLDHYEVLQDDDQPQQQQQQQQADGDSAEEALSGGGGISRQPDIASTMLGAMEADYRACVESEERSASNGPMAPSRTSVFDAEAPSQEDTQRDAIEALPRERDEALPGGQEDGAESAGQVPPPRPISPLGQDQAERVMRAMQGFALAAPAPPSAQFEVDWESPGVLANLTAPAAAAAGTSTTAAPAAPARRIEVEEKEGEGKR